MRRHRWRWGRYDKVGDAGGLPIEGEEEGVEVDVGEEVDVHGDSEIFCRDVRSCAAL
jgi:hypothetical protein